MNNEKSDDDLSKTDIQTDGIARGVTGSHSPTPGCEIVIISVSDPLISVPLLKV